MACFFPLAQRQSWGQRDWNRDEGGWEGQNQAGGINRAVWQEILDRGLAENWGCGGYQQEARKVGSSQ